MSTLYLNNLGHAYAGGIYALKPTDLVFEHGKTYALLGPSGCGKTTLLNIISGLLRPSQGQVLFENQDMTLVPTAQRNIAQVFQFPVIYQSKSVFENLAFPLQCRGWDKSRIATRVHEIADMLGLSSRLNRAARHLTVDEKQLISLGRGLVRDDVAAILMDEPLTVIDPQMKFELRRRIKQAHAYAKVTVIYVTHDQNEAMTFADEILVMKDGSVVQRGTPEELFERPINAYVGNFIGSPGMNFLPLDRSESGLHLAGKRVAAPCEHLPEGGMTLGVRPENISFTHLADENGFAARIESIEDQGSVRVLELSIQGVQARMKLAREKPVPAADSSIAVRFSRYALYADGRLL